MVLLVFTCFKNDPFEVEMSCFICELQNYIHVKTVSKEAHMTGRLQKHFYIGKSPIFQWFFQGIKAFP